MSRRSAIQIIGNALFCSGGGVSRLAAQPIVNLPAEFAAIEATSGGRLGVYGLDTGSGNIIGHRAESRFGMCSTFKFLLAAAVLHEHDHGRLDLNTLIPFTKADLIANSPITKANIRNGAMTIRDLAHATQLTSDNTAANLLLKKLGGPTGFTAMLRAMGDPITRVDRIEPAMNLVPAGELRDTTTPRAIAETAARLLTGQVLTPSSRAMLIEWMIETQTGLKRIRANVPKNWRVGDKTGTGSHPSMPNKYNDVAILMPPNRAPITVACYYEGPAYFAEMRAEDEAVLAKVGEVVVGWVSASN